MWYNRHAPSLTLPLCGGNLATPHPLISRVFPGLPGRSPGDGLQVQQGPRAAGLSGRRGRPSASPRGAGRAALARLPDRDALSNLRYALASLRRTIGDHAATPPFLLITPQTIQFNPASDHWLDVAELERQIADSRWQCSRWWQNAVSAQSCIAAASWPVSPSATRRLLRSGRCCGASRSACR